MRAVRAYHNSKLHVVVLTVCIRLSVRVVGGPFYTGPWCSRGQSALHCLTFDICCSHTGDTPTGNQQHRQLPWPGLRKPLWRNLENTEDYLLFCLSSRDDDGAVSIVREMETHIVL